MHGAKEWFKQLKENCDIKNIVIGLVGNKQDLESSREVNEKEARQFASSIGATFWEASAKTGHNVSEVFYDVCCKLEEQNNQNLTVIPEPISYRDRTLTVISNQEDQDAGQRASPSRTFPNCCHRNM